MKKKQNHLLTVILLLITALMLTLAFFLSPSKNHFKKMIKEEVKDIADDLGIEILEPEQLNLLDVHFDTVDYDSFIAFNHNMHEHAEKDGENNLYKELLKSVNTLYLSAKDFSEYDERDYNTSGEKHLPITFKLTNSYLTKNEAELNIPDTQYSTFSKGGSAFDNNDNMREGYSYCVVEIQVTNTSNRTISRMSTFPTSEIFFCDETGDLFYRTISCLYNSYQPGHGTKAYFFDDFKPGDSFTTYCVFGVPDLVFEYYDCCFTICPSGNGAFPPEMSTMVILDSMKQKAIDLQPEE